MKISFTTPEDRSFAVVALTAVLAHGILASRAAIHPAMMKQAAEGALELLKAIEALPELK